MAPFLVPFVPQADSSLQIVSLQVNMFHLLQEVAAKISFFDCNIARFTWLTEAYRQELSLRKSFLKVVKLKLPIIYSKQRRRKSNWSA